MYVEFEPGEKYAKDLKEISEYLKTSYFTKKYKVRPQVLTEFRRHAKCEIILDEKSKLWLFPLEAEEEFKEFLRQKERRKEIKDSHITISKLARILGLGTTTVSTILARNNIEVETIRGMTYIDKDLIPKIKELAKASKAKVNPNICPCCGKKLNNLGDGEKYCRPCEKFFKRGREITYSESGEVIYIKRRKRDE